MKHIFHTLMTLTGHGPKALPAYASRVERLEKTPISEQAVRAITHQGFLLTYFLEDRDGDIDPQLVLFVADPEGEPVEDAQVIFTVIDPQGTNLLAEATPRNGGYALRLNGRSSSTLRIETVVVKSRQMLLDDFHFAVKPLVRAV
ncbi:hypothetical protein DESUT3_33660 [Desulfuromonas versatilis]|uniref:Big-1 domain-containing protein n=1 Tax=Desulfuromonas versatilis TaxID=2802975 RepID=A0ABM8HZX1_9BACT|nr:hypothetical protein [Desulfuromonas versatilis]BCR06297.1 hypothetical protein DESUT3_33660 [Desulfuromonas versatilis]